MINNKIIKLLLFLICLLVIVPVIGCTASQIGQEYIDFSARATEDYLIAINNRDFSSFSRNLNKDMEEASPEEEFLTFVDQIEGLIGTYEPGSKKLDQTKKDSGYIVITYNARYTGESEEVIVTISLQKTGDKIEIAGSWFNSPKLRGE
ncbi:MAG: DUF3887 domain-containing protein [Actinomycetia bacterium]|nr:DUF3887 domain-containing protein [Actinomycetes bacterium]